MESAFPLWVLVLDYALGVVMWTLIGRTAMNVFFFMKFFVRATNPLLKAFDFITPGFLIRPLVPLYIAWFFFMFRFYVMPWLLGYEVMGMLSFPLESDIAKMIYRLGS